MAHRLDALLRGYASTTGRGKPDQAKPEHGQRGGLRNRDLLRPISAEQ
jgi:hypothetical protein